MVITHLESWRVMALQRYSARIRESKNSSQRGLLRPSPLFPLSVWDRVAEYSHPYGAGVKMLCGELGKGPEMGPRGDAMSEK